jgi:acetolactate synthase-1/2/3 large subunit
VVPISHRLGVPGGEYDPLPTYRNVTKWAARVNYVERVPEMLRRAFSQLRVGQGAPVLLEIPRDVMGAEVDEARFAYTPARGYRSAGDPEDVAEAARLLLAASRPVLHAEHRRPLGRGVGRTARTGRTPTNPGDDDDGRERASSRRITPCRWARGGHTLARAAGEALVRADLILGVGASFAKGSFSAPLPAGDAGADHQHRARHRPRLPHRPRRHRRRQAGAAPADRRGAAQGGGGARGGYIDAAGEIRESREAERQEWLPRLTSAESPINPYG